LDNDYDVIDDVCGDVGNDNEVQGDGRRVEEVSQTRQAEGGMRQRQGAARFSWTERQVDVDSVEAFSAAFHPIASMPWLLLTPCFVVFFIHSPINNAATYCYG